MITVKREKSVKIAIDACELNNELKKDKHQMPNVEHLIDMVAEQLDKTCNGNAWYISLNLLYAYGQV